MSRPKGTTNGKRRIKRLATPNTQTANKSIVSKPLLIGTKPAKYQRKANHNVRHTKAVTTAHWNTLSSHGRRRPLTSTPKAKKPRVRQYIKAIFTAGMRL